MRILKCGIIPILTAALLFLGAACGPRDTAPRGGEQTPPEQVAPDPGTALGPPLDWPEPGKPAPEFRLPSLAGGEVSVPGDFAGRAVLMLFFSLG